MRALGCAFAAIALTMASAEPSVAEDASTKDACTFAVAHSTKVCGDSIASNHGPLAAQDSCAESARRTALACGALVGESAASHKLTSTDREVQLMQLVLKLIAEKRNGSKAKGKTEKRNNTKATGKTKGIAPKKEKLPCAQDRKGCSADQYMRYVKKALPECASLFEATTEGLQHFEKKKAHKSAAFKLYAKTFKGTVIEEHNTDDVASEVPVSSPPATLLDWMQRVFHFKQQFGKLQQDLKILSIRIAILVKGVMLFPMTAQIWGAAVWGAVLPYNVGQVVHVFAKLVRVAHVLTNLVRKMSTQVSFSGKKGGTKWLCDILTLGDSNGFVCRTRRPKSMNQSTICKGLLFSTVSNEWLPAVPSGKKGILSGDISAGVRREIMKGAPKVLKFVTSGISKIPILGNMLAGSVQKIFQKMLGQGKSRLGESVGRRRRRSLMKKFGNTVKNAKKEVWKAGKVAKGAIAAAVKKFGKMMLSRLTKVFLGLVEFMAHVTQPWMKKFFPKSPQPKKEYLDRQVPLYEIGNGRYKTMTLQLLRQPLIKQVHCQQSASAETCSVDKVTQSSGTGQDQGPSEENLKELMRHF